jgi:hypothetical protein
VGSSDPASVNPRHQTAQLTLLPDRNPGGRDKQLILDFESEADVEAWMAVLTGACDPTRTTYEPQTGGEEEVRHRGLSKLGGEASVGLWSGGGRMRAWSGESPPIL